MIAGNTTEYDACEAVDCTEMGEVTAGAIDAKLADVAGADIDIAPAVTVGVATAALKDAIAVTETTPATTSGAITEKEQETDVTGMFCAAVPAPKVLRFLACNDIE